jgi:hypothetical protein
VKREGKREDTNYTRVARQNKSGIIGESNETVFELDGGVKGIEQNTQCGFDITAGKHGDRQ